MSLINNTPSIHPGGPSVTVSQIYFRSNVSCHQPVALNVAGLFTKKDAHPSENPTKADRCDYVFGLP